MPYVRITRPTSSDKYYIRKTSGGYSGCIQGAPKDNLCDTLANCVGFACGFFNEYYGQGYEVYHLTCNAENFIERAIASGLSIVKNPVVGGILVWANGKIGDSSDGAGHVAGCTWVNDVDNPTQIKTSESSYGGAAFFTTTRNIGSSGNWGAGNGYWYRGCIVPPNYVKPDYNKPQEPTKPEPTILKEGDTVEILSTGNGSSYGDSNTAYGLGWKRKILKVYDGRPYPYRVGNETGTTGFYKAEALKKI